MKGSVIAASAASFIGAVSAGHAGHAGFHNRRNFFPTAVSYEEVCSTYTTTWCGEATLVPETATYASNSTAYVTPSPLPASTSSLSLPTAEVTTCPTPGTYTFPAKTMTVTDTTTVCGATTTAAAPGTHTFGGVTTSVVTETTITCPYAAVETSGSVTTSVIKTTTYVCPSAGEYTIAPMTSSCSESTTFVYPTVTSFAPGTYTHPETTVTIVKTSEVFVCPYETSKTLSSYVAPTSAAYSKPAYSAPANSAPAYSAPAYSAPAYSAPAYSAPASSVAASSAKPSATGSYSGGQIETNGNQWGMTYTPYTTTGQCKSASDVMSDIKVIKGAGFTTVRVYSTDCSALENIGAACEANGMQMILGIFIDSSGISGAQDQVEAIKAWAKWDLVSMCIVGNEAIFNKYCSASELASFIVSVREEFQGAGCPSSVPFTTAEPLSTMQEVGGDMCHALDVMAANIQPFFTSSVVASEAGKFVKGQLELLAEVCPEVAEKGCYNSESGWPTKGESNGQAVPGFEEQKAAIENIIEECGKQSVIFSYQNDEWKSPGSFGVEQSWGCSDLFA